ncbi:MAG TPA: DNA translocase FtsK [Candidatus Hydrogenedens sp.]|nr:DNA translocase FtsK [Candidatus Hydrogenedens sp.]
MFYNKKLILIKSIISVLLFLISGVIFLSVIFDSPVLPSGESRQSIEHVCTYIPFFPKMQHFVSFFQLVFGPAIHSIYLVLFIWAIALWDTRHSFSITLRFMGLITLSIGLSIFSQAYNLYSTGELHEECILGLFIVERILANNFGILPSLIVAFMLILAGFFLSLDWIALYFFQQIFLIFSFLYAIVKSVFVFILKGVAWINTNFISLEQQTKQTIVTESPSGQLHFPLADTENVDAYSPNKNQKDEVDTSLLPDLPSLDMGQESFETTTTPVIITAQHDTDNYGEVISSYENPGSVKANPQKESSTEEKKNKNWIFPKKEKKETPDANSFINNNLAYSLDGEPIRSGQPAQQELNIPQKRVAESEYPEQYTKPQLSLLDKPVPLQTSNYDEQLWERAKILVETLKRFGVMSRVTGITRGPTITRFELEPEPGIKVTRFLSHADDITLALKADRVRVEAPIPGKGKVGVEVPNLVREQVLLRELLESPVMNKHRGRLRLPLGKDIAGEVKVVDLTQMPHLLIAGATGSGKTVFVKALLASLLFQYTPDELRLVLIDPKMVEFSIFKDIPHLLEHVVTDAKKAGEALDILVKEMEERYNLFAKTSSRNLEIYNQNVEKGQLELFKSGERDLFSTPIKVSRKLPYIVCIIDELADLMMLQRATVENAIARLSQLARAVGIHLIVATQRPSVDVITGVIKANFPARISFQVSSKIDSRCILDTIGAEKLIGHGDMLYHNAGLPKPTRIQGAFVSDREIENLVNYLKTQSPPQYFDSMGFEQLMKKENEFAPDDNDPLFEEAIRIVRETKQASVSLLQRRLRIGYARAGHLIDLMELHGIVGPHRGSKPREILLPPANVETDNFDIINHNKDINLSDEED